MVEDAAKAHAVWLENVSEGKPGTVNVVEHFCKHSTKRHEGECFCVEVWVLEHADDVGRGLAVGFLGKTEECVEKVFEDFWTTAGVGFWMSASVNWMLFCCR